jgi:hypothetical protein
VEMVMMMMVAMVMMMMVVVVATYASIHPCMHHFPLGKKSHLPNKIIDYILTPTEIRHFKLTSNLSFPLKISTQLILLV